MAGVEISQLCKQFRIGDQIVTAVNNASAAIADGSFTVIVGKSGCGKTTLLRLLGGLEQATAGRIRWAAAAGAVPPKIGFVFQEPRLMPWLTVFENMAFSLDRSLPPAVVENLVLPTLRQLGLESFRDAYPAHLSGGMAQRVSLGRTLCFQPEVILMDEPFGALDYFTRKKLQREIMELFLSQRKTLILVTHDVTEAIFLAQTVLVMDAGSLIREIPVPLPYPRAPASPGFLQIQAEILDALGGL
ncbi:MAG: ABC transporter ATP-binding protein [Veillonellaceae bacterium]|nr:ABC transporter ATP-binding protein [Veillonellaceae bacterium]